MLIKKNLNEIGVEIFLLVFEKYKHIVIQQCKLNSIQMKKKNYGKIYRNLILDSKIIQRYHLVVVSFLI